MELAQMIKAVRKDSHKTQTDFGKLLGCTRDTIANYEGGRAVPSDTFLQLMCSKFSISENWLRTGQGEMHQETETTLFSSFAKQYDLSKAEQKAARYLLQLSSAERQQILKCVSGLAAAIASAEDETATAIDKELAAYKKELLAEQKGLSASGIGEEKNA